MRERLKAWFWRDPDPVWRWASGQIVRRWWNQTGFLILVACGLLLILDFVLLPFCFGFAFENRSQAYELGRHVTTGALFFCTILFFVFVAAHPTGILKKLGGAPMLRDVSLTTLGRERIPSILYWGSFRSIALPSMMIVYCMMLAIGFLFLLEGSHLDEPDEIEAFLWIAGTMSVVFVLKPPIDHMLNLSIGWWFCFKSGRRVTGQLTSLFLVVLLFPGLFWLITVILAIPIMASGLYLNDQLAVYFVFGAMAVSVGSLIVSILLVVPRQNGLFWIRVALPLTVLACAVACIAPLTELAVDSPQESMWIMCNVTAYVTIYLVKIWYARRRYRKFVKNWDTLLNEKFGD